jgi:hypothetical protein
MHPAGRSSNSTLSMMDIEDGAGQADGPRAGKRPRYNDMDDMPKPTEHMKQRTEDVGINKNLNKTMLVQTSTGKGPRGAGFYVSKATLRRFDVDKWGGVTW